MLIFAKHNNIIMCYHIEESRDMNANSMSKILIFLFMHINCDTCNYRSDDIVFDGFTVIIISTFYTLHKQIHVENKKK